MSDGQLIWITTLTCSGLLIILGVILIPWKDRK